MRDPVPAISCFSVCIDELLHHLLPVVGELERVVSGKERVWNPRKTRAETSLYHHHGFRPLYLYDGHS